MEISVRLEGGIGDVLLGNRFVPAIIDKYPQAKVSAFIDAGGNPSQKEVLTALYDRLYLGGIYEIPNKKYTSLKIKTQLGEIDGNGALENVPDEWRQRMESYDKFYDLHIDFLRWTKYDFDWMRYFRFFPRPVTANVEDPTPKHDIILHLFSKSNPAHRLDPWYIKYLLSSLSTKYKCCVICDDDSREFLSSVAEMENVALFAGDLRAITNEIERSSMMISIDSGLRYLAYGLSKPVLTFTSSCKTPHAIPTNIFLRWMPFPESTYPINYNYPEIVRITRLILDQNPASVFVPEIRDFDKHCHYYRAER